MKKIDLNAIREHLKMNVLYVLVMLYAVLIFFSIFKTAFYWTGALYLVFYSFSKAMHIAELEDQLNDD